MKYRCLYTQMVSTV